MLRDIYAIAEDEPRYQSDVIELTSPLDSLIQQIDILLFTKKGDVLMIPNFGCNLEEYLFETSWNEETIKGEVQSQINKYISNPYGFIISVDVSFVKWDFNVAMIVDIMINDQKVSSYLV